MGKYNLPSAIRRKGKVVGYFFLLALAMYVMLMVSHAGSVEAAPLPAPTNLTAVMSSSQQINLSWSDNAATETAYQIERSLDGSKPWTVIAMLGANVTSYQDRGLIQNTMYYYRIRCTSGSAHSKYSNSTSAVTASLSGPSALTVTVASATQLSLSWADNTEYETQYSIERSPTGSGSWTAISAAAPDSMTMTDSTVTAGTAYLYRVRAFDGTNYSVYSNTAGQTIRTLSAEAGQNGSISPSGTIGVADGSNQSFTIVPATGYRIASIAVNGAYVAVNSTYTIENITSNQTISAAFTELTYTITSSAGPNGSIVPSGTMVARHGTCQGYSITPSAGYTIASMVVDGISVATSGTYTFSAIDSSHTIAASFADITPPTGSFVINNGASATNNPSVMLTLSAADAGSGVAQMQFSNDGSTWSPAEPYATSKSWNVTSGDGTKTIHARFMDKAGNWSAAPITGIITLDTVMPVVSMALPLPGFTNNTMPKLVFTVSEAPITLNITVDGKTVARGSGDALGPLLQGQHTVRVDAVDGAGNIGSAEVSFAVVVDAPRVVLASPAAGIMVSNMPVLQYTVNYGAITVFVDGVAVGTSSGDSLDLLSDGYHMVRVESVDASGFIAGAEVEFLVDTTPPLVSGLSGFTKVAAGDSHSAAITSDGNMLWWGYMIEYGDANTAMPRAIGTARAWQSVASAFEGSIALKTDGSLWGWGCNPNFNITNRSGFTPSRIGMDADWMDISAQGSDATMVKNEGTLWILSHQRRNPLQIISADRNWSAIATGSVQGAPYGIGIRKLGTLWAWGAGYPNLPGMPAGVYTGAITQIGSDTNWSAVSAGKNHIIALKTDGTLWAWGDNAYGQLGNGTGTGNYLPVQVGSDSDWSKIAAGYYHSLALKNDGSLWAWGANWYGQLGDGSENHRSVPVRIGTDKDWMAISAGGYHSLAIKADGSLWTWGVNWEGNTGNPPEWTRPHPVYSPKDPILIDNGAVLTNTLSVMLSLNAWDIASGLGYMKFSEDGSSWSEQEAYAASKAWTLSPGNGVKTVSVMFRDVAGNWSPAYSTTIFLVEGAPSITITSPAAGLTNDRAPLLNYSVSEGSVVVKVDGQESSTVSGTRLEPLADGNHIIRVEATNAQGTAFAAVAFTVDTLAPQVSIMSPVAGTSRNRTPMLSYTASDGEVDVTVDGQVVTSGSGQALSSLPDGPHSVTVRATDMAGNTGSAQVRFVVDNTPPTLFIESPEERLYTVNSLQLSYGASDGAATVSIDGGAGLPLPSGSMLNGLSNGSHTIVVSSKDIAGNVGSASVTFMVDTMSVGNDDTNIYCSGTGTYVVGPSKFTSGILVPSSGNTVLIAAPADGATITGVRTIVKGTMDTTIPVNSVMIVVTNGTTTGGYPAQVNGKYFAAKVPVTADTKTITAIATDQAGAKHQANVSVSVATQQSYVELLATPSVGIPVSKNGRTASLDASLTSTATTTHVVTKYAWDFDGSGTDEVTCYGHKDIIVSYQQTGLYLTRVTVTDTIGNKYTDTAIVNVLDRSEMNSIFAQKWEDMKNVLRVGNITQALSYLAEGSQEVYQHQFAVMAPHLSQIVGEMGAFNLLKYVSENIVEGEFRTIQDGTQYSFQVIFTRDGKGNWIIRSF